MGNLDTYGNYEGLRLKRHERTCFEKLSAVFEVGVMSG